ncbi:Hsp70 family protein [Synechococcales cyanobacterium C]|uniref:Hsp70 family protein n=1 Tax=Petrachloros mirabilis ULC683 TaxID=2781853 RepID=A0A8K2A251_9CYAN|nr:Hsp70 family protein [Petrachloros mirabilis]NCJ08461.1 Hsp70 family protein [Petrachloros mirabilis ULC683]
MSKVVGIDLGTTNSVVAALEEGQPWVIPDEEGEQLLPSYVGLSESGQLLVGQAARRQYAAAPERTVKSIKRQMGTDYTVTLGDLTYRPQEISAILLRSLKQRAEAMLEEEVAQAVITVPAYFTDAQRQATKEAGEIAGFEVLQILNEPTAAALVFEVKTEDSEKVLVYDLGGGTFDVSIVEITGEVTEVLASHGNNRLGGDDFDRQLQRHLADRFFQTHDVEVPNDAATQARLLQAAEQAKIALSEHAFTTVREPFLVSKGETALHLEAEIAREDFENLIKPYLKETLEAIDRALEDANMSAADLDQVILVGGSTRIPLIQHQVEAHLPDTPVSSFEPDLCVGLGAALQAGVLTGEDIDAILVDVSPHSLGIAAIMDTQMGAMPGFFSTIIPRNTVIPTSRSKVYYTSMDGQETVEIEVFQGENPIARENVPLGSFLIEGIPQKPAGAVQVEVHFDFDLNGILTVTATEKGKGQQESLVVNDAETGRLSSHELSQARDAIASLFETAVEDFEDEDLEIEVDKALEITSEDSGDEAN